MMVRCGGGCWWWLVVNGEATTSEQAIKKEKAKNEKGLFSNKLVPNIITLYHVQAFDNCGRTDDVICFGTVQVQSLKVTNEIASLRKIQVLPRYLTST